MTRTAVVLFNLGGPDRPEAVQPFLQNLFSDPAIIGLPGFLRLPLARLISKRRAKVAAGIYERMGGGSPLLPLTRAQGEALEAALADPGETRVFIAMRYWHPLAGETARAVREWGAERLVLLPLYPQYSTTTSASSLADWKKAAEAAGLDLPTRAICCYSTEAGLVEAQAALIRPALAAASAKGRPRLLFSAHGLPQKVVDGGDPYQWQVERTAAKVADALAMPDLDWLVCYQSRVGPLKWIGPSTEAEIERAGRDGVPLVVVPIAFVSEHSETLVELDIEYAEKAHAAGVPAYHRVPALGTTAPFIAGLARLVREALARDTGIAADGGRRLCPASCRRCAMAGA
ncbi:MAG: ferrochelatase [Alphaproteobacteria bacterium]|nr:ferrochelatase [Alphaproteobacteria bacterium]